MNGIDSIDTYTKYTLQNGDLSIGIGLLNIHTIPKYKNQLNWMTRICVLKMVISMVIIVIWILSLDLL